MTELSLFRLQLNKLGTFTQCPQFPILTIMGWGGGVYYPELGNMHSYLLGYL